MDKTPYFLPKGSLLHLPEEETEYLLNGVVLVIAPSIGSSGLIGLCLILILAEAVCNIFYFYLVHFYGVIESSLFLH